MIMIIQSFLSLHLLIHLNINPLCPNYLYLLQNFMHEFILNPSLFPTLQENFIYHFEPLATIEQSLILFQKHFI